MPLTYTDCPLYGLKSKRMLRRLLRIEDSKFLKQDYVASMVSPYIDKKGKPRLIEPPREELKIIQKRIKQMLGQIIVPSNVFSGIKGRSYADNVVMHIGANRRNLFKIDLTAFFPSISRETVYRFFYEDLCCSPDAAEILTNFTTIDLDKSQANCLDEIYGFLDSKGVSCKNHLISGAPTSQIMSYLVNYQMFDEMQKIADENNAVMTVYVDDVTFSTENRISKDFREKIVAIVRKYGYQISKSKVKKYTKLYPKLVTGVVIDSEGKPVIKNSMREKIIKEHCKKFTVSNRTEMVKPGKKPCTSKISWHGLRHTYAQETYARYICEGMSVENALRKVSENLGHHRMSITDVYLDENIANKLKKKK